MPHSASQTFLRELDKKLQVGAVASVRDRRALSHRIPNGSSCLFRESSDGSRNGKVIIVQSRDIQNPDTGGRYTVKIYRSEKTETQDSWSHRGIRLEPDSMDFNFKPLILDSNMVNDLRVIGEFVAIIS